MFAGEYIKNDRGDLPHETVYLYDCYMWEGTDVRRLNLVSDIADEPTRIGYVQKAVDILREQKKNDETNEMEYHEPAIGSGIRLRAKEMRIGDVKEESMKIWENRHAYPYVLDGIILTPAYEPVGRSDKNTWEWGFRMDRTWHTNLKWKPPKFNTVDFILAWTGGIVRGEDGLVRKGVLRTTEMVVKNGVRCTVFPLFQPTEYTMPQPYKIEVNVGSVREPRTEETNEFIHNNSVVECRFDHATSRWIVLRNRNDKTKAWSHSRKAIQTALSQYTSLLHIIHTQSNWKRTVLQQIFTIGRGQDARDTKHRKLDELVRKFSDFLVFHGIIPSGSDESTMVQAIKNKKESILTLINEPYVEVPLPFSLPGSNATFVANTIWKSIHEPVELEHFGSPTAPSSGAGEDDVPPVAPLTRSEAFLPLPIDPALSRAMVERVRSWITTDETSSILEISDRDTPVIEGSVLWTNQISIRKTPHMIRGDAKKFKTGWLSVDDSQTWKRWNTETMGATTLLTLGLWGSMENKR